MGLFVSCYLLYWCFSLNIKFYLSPCGCRDVRLGRNGANEVKTHAWFRNDSWTWDNIRQQVPPVVPELSSDVDTQYFDVIDDEKEKPESFSTPRVSCYPTSVMS